MSIVSFLPSNILHHHRNYGRGDELPSLLVSESEAGLHDSLSSSPHWLLQSDLQDPRELEQVDCLPGCRQQEIIYQGSPQPQLSSSGLESVWKVGAADTKIVQDS